MQNKSSYLSYCKINNAIQIKALPFVLQNKLQNKCNQEGLAGA